MPIVVKVSSILEPYQISYLTNYQTDYSHARFSNDFAKKKFNHLPFFGDFIL